MLINEDEVKKRLNNPLNLLNRVKNNEFDSKRKNAMSLFVKPAAVVQESIVSPFRETITVVEDKEDNKPSESAEDFVKDLDEKVKLALAHDNALELMTNSIDMLKTKLNDVKPEKIPAIINAAGKVVESIRKERIEINKINKGQDVHHHFYMPVQRKVEDYEIVEVSQ
jgi:hypothetical protein